MAYPFAQMPTLREFVDQAKAAGCEEVPIPGPIMGPKGPANIRCLQGHNGSIAVLPDMDEDEHLTPTVVGNLCRRLKIEIDLPTAPTP